MLAWLIAFVVAACSMAVNVVIYVGDHTATLNLCAAIFCGTLAIVDLVMAAHSA